MPSEGTDYQSLPNAVVALLPTPQTVDVSDKAKVIGPNGRTLADHGPNLRDVVALLPTPAVNDMGAAYTPETWDAWTADMKAKHNNGNGHGKSLNVEAQRLLPTPSVADSTGGHERRGGERGEELLLKGVARAVAEGALPPTPTAGDSKQSGASGYDSGHDGTTLTDATVRQPARWGEYEPAIRRCEAITRPAPEPTKLNAKGNPKLSDEFDEWLMMLPAGWITEVPGITWNEVLKACGNGVVPPQAAAALRFLLGMADYLRGEVAA